MAHKIIRRSLQFEDRIARYRGKQPEEGHVYLEFIEGQLLADCVGRMSENLQHRVHEALTKTVRGLLKIDISHGNISSYNVMIHKVIWSCSAEASVDEYVVLIDFSHANVKSLCSEQRWRGRCSWDISDLKGIKEAMKEDLGHKRMYYTKRGKEYMYRVPICSDGKNQHKP